MERVQSFQLSASSKVPSFDKVTLLERPDRLPSGLSCLNVILEPVLKAPFWATPCMVVIWELGCVGLESEEEPEELEPPPPQAAIKSEIAKIASLFISKAIPSYELVFKSS